MTETQEQISDKLVNKVRGLLRLSKSDNENEAELAMKHAKRLCVQYDLDIASIDANKTKNTEEPIVQNSIRSGSRFSVAQTNVANILASHFNVRVIYSGNRFNGRKVLLIGRKRDIEVGTWINEYLNEEFLRLWRRYYQQNKPYGVTLANRAGYLYGLRQGLSSKLEDEKRRVEQAAFTKMPESAKQTYALSIVGHDKRLDDKVNEFFPVLGTHRPHTIKNRNSVGDGKIDGRNISLNRPLGQGKSTGQLTK